ncbi:Crp/Fnr family transcriptional regulator [Arcanobacterium pinnipediorum]|uniref:Crp/Fnr family transcriptional regulator n=1 Tax=Arcanobacterium pinnipediorum TaxID=1503041 RepID=A0ABY5AFZ5_9ACTO|nr:Crp/Fnr family transcriptional regulator [Arcanobacterium pinnipediorum]USR78795.1 Crp/Fnr family transcriptional regulator [Arcanobacterium pinnipediorum]
MHSHSDQFQPCLREVDLFTQIPQEELIEFNRILPRKTFTAGHIIYDPLRPEVTLFIVKTGRVRIFQINPNGKTFTLAIYRPGDIFGNMPIIGQYLSSSYAEAIEESTLCQLSMADVESYFLADLRISQELTRILAKRVTDLENRLSDMALRPLAQRLASLLLTTGQPSSIPWKNHLTVTMTHEQLASLAGSTREAVSKTLADLARRGMITQKRGSIILLQPKQLQIFKDVLDE